jgi:methanogenic corrinoid protein MtbC1
LVFLRSDHLLHCSCSLFFLPILPCACFFLAEACHFQLSPGDIFSFSGNSAIFTLLKTTKLMQTDELLKHLSVCVEKGKADRATPTPPEMKDQDGAREITARLIEMDVAPEQILNGALIPGMKRIGDLYGEGKAFVPHLLLAARAMNEAIVLLKPYFDSGAVERKGTFIIGTVQGDLHDIGKNLVKAIIEGSGWEVVDLGTDVSPDGFIKAIEEHPNAPVGLSALITTTMVQMEQIVQRIREKYPDKKILIGGAPVTQEYCDKIGADFFSLRPQEAAEYLNALVS